MLPELLLGSGTLIDGRPWVLPVPAPVEVPTLELFIPVGAGVMEGADDTLGGVLTLLDPGELPLELATVLVEGETLAPLVGVDVPIGAIGLASSSPVPPQATPTEVAISTKREARSVGATDKYFAIIVDKVRWVGVRSIACCSRGAAVA
jgi:hypothetical protein